MTEQRFSEATKHGRDLQGRAAALSDNCKIAMPAIALILCTTIDLQTQVSEGASNAIVTHLFVNIQKTNVLPFSHVTLM